MNQRLRLLVVLLVLVPSATPLIASQVINSTKRSFFGGLGRAALLPFTLLQVPIMKGAEMLANKSNEAPQSLPQLKETPVTPPLPETFKATPSQTHTTQSANPTVNIPKVVESVFAGIPKESTRPVFINVNVNTQQAGATAHTESTEVPAPEKPAPAPSVTPVIPLAAKIEEPKASQYLSKAKEWVLNNKIKCAVTCGATMYSGLHLYLWHASRTLSRATSWSLWKPICSLNNLYQTNQKELIKSIMDSLQEAYHNDNQLVNAQRFTKEASDELALLRRYKNVLGIIDRWYLRRIFFVNRSLITSIPERIHRLEFLKNTLAGWLKEHQQTYCYDKLFSAPLST